MTPAGIFVGAVIGCVLIAWVINLIWYDRLYVGYGVIFVLGAVLGILVLLVPPLLDRVTALSVALLPVPALSLVAIVIVLFLLVYVFTQITILSNRVTRLTQELAIRSAQERGASKVEGEPR